MNEIKPWYQSKTIWGALVAVLASLLSAAGIDLDAEAQNGLTTDILNLCGALGGLFALYGRLTANTSIDPPG